MIIGDGEPRDGTREEWVRALLMAGYRGQGSLRINSRETSVTGLALADRFVSVLEVQRLVACPPLTPLQQMIIVAYYRDDQTNEQIGRCWGISGRTVGREKAEAIRRIVASLWPDGADGA